MTAERERHSAPEGRGAALSIAGDGGLDKVSVLERVDRRAGADVGVAFAGGVVVERDVVLGVADVGWGGWLLERESEILLIDGVLSRVLRGEGRRLVVEGSAGVGKSALLECSGERARARGVEVRACQCSEGDAEVALSAARGLLGDGVLGVGGREGELGASGLVQAALAIGRSGPVLLVVDDVQWADQVSLRFLAALARRIACAPVALALAVGDWGVEREGALGELLDDRRAVVLRPRPLSVDAAGELIAARVGERVCEPLVTMAHRQTAGNPYLLGVVGEALCHLGPGDAGEPEALAGEIAAREATRLVAWQRDRLGGEERALIEAAAVLGELGAPEALAGLVGADPAGWADAARRLAAADLLVSCSGTRLTHPLLKVAIRAKLGARREIELVRGAAAALVLAGRVQDAAERLAGLPPTGDPQTAQTLAQAAEIALAGGAPQRAAGLLERALREPPAPACGPELHARLGEALLALGHPDAADHLERALAGLVDPERRAAIARALAGALSHTLQIEQAADVLDLVASELEAECPELAEDLQALTLPYESMISSLRPRRLARLRTLSARRGHSELAYRIGLVEQAAEWHGACHPAQEIIPSLERALAAGVLLTGAPEVHFKALVILTQMHQTALAGTQLRDAITRAQEHGHSARARTALGLQGELALIEGNVLAAATDARSALEPSGYHHLATPLSVKVLIQALIEQDRPESALQELRRCKLTWDLPPLASQAAILYACGLAHHACGTLQLALEEFQLAGESLQRFGNDTPAALPWRSAAATILTQLDQPEPARALAAQEIALAEQTAIPETIAHAYRTHANLLPSENERLIALRHAVALLQHSNARLEHAHALTELATAERTKGHATKARELAHQSWTIAEQLGANKLAIQARDELIHAGGRPRRPTLHGISALTAAELKVATLAAHGMTNTHIANTLTLATKTIEGHLANTYRKLDINGRTQLAATILPPNAPQTSQ